MESIRLIPVLNEPNLYSLDMNFDSNFDCIITIHLCATEARNVANIPLYYHSDSKLSPHAYWFSSGLNQKFPHQLYLIDLELVYQVLRDVKQQKDVLYSVTEDFVPIMVQIETVYPANYSGRGKKNFEFTYGCFEKGESRPDGTYLQKYKAIKQKLLYNN